MLRNAPRRIPSSKASRPARDKVFNVMVQLLSNECAGASEGCRVGFGSADSHRALDAQYEDFAVTDLAGLCGSRNGIDGLIDLVGRHRDFDLELGKEAHGVFGAAVDFRVALLTPIPFDFR